MNELELKSAASIDGLLRSMREAQSTLPHHNDYFADSILVIEKLRDALERMVAFTDDVLRAFRIQGGDPIDPYGDMDFARQILTTPPEQTQADC